VLHLYPHFLLPRFDVSSSRRRLASAALTPFSRCW
jgi:hypothetical protein